LAQQKNGPSGGGNEPAEHHTAGGGDAKQPHTEKVPEESPASKKQSRLGKSASFNGQKAMPMWI
jgi:hypothetical protein